MSNLPKLGWPHFNFHTEWLRDLEYYEGPLLSVVASDYGFMIEKWCTCNEGRTVDRTLLVPVPYSALIAYEKSEIDLLTLLLSKDGNYYLVDYTTDSVTTSGITYWEIPKDYLPDPGVFHDRGLNPNVD